MATYDGRWRPTPGAVVRFTPNHDRPDDEPAPPPGTWKIIDRNDRGPQHWWVLALDDTARAWAEAHPGLVISRCVDAHGRDLSPVNRVRL